MVSYLRRSLFKWRYAILIILIISAMAGAFSFQINRWLPHYALSFSNVIAQQLQTRISFKRAYYRFPNYIIFKNVNVFEFNQKTPMLKASMVMVGFNDIIMDDLIVNFPVFKNYLIRHSRRIHTWTKSLPKRNMRLLVPNGEFYFKNYPDSDAIPFKIDLSLDQDHISADGFWGDKDRFNYKLYGNVHDLGFDLGHLTVGNGNSSLDLWGSWHTNMIKWKGFIFYDKFNILDINGNLDIQDKDITLKQLSFTVNGDDVTGSGNCSRQNFFQCDADINYSRQRQNFSLHLHTQNTPQGLFFKGQAGLGQVSTDFADLQILPINGNSLKLKIGKSTIFLNLKDRMLIPNEVPLKDLSAVVNFDKPYHQTITLYTQLFAGNCVSRFFLDTSTFPWQIKAQGKFDKIELPQGSLSGNFDLQSSKNLTLSGILALHNGHFDNTHFQEWAVKTLQMPSLEHVSGADFYCRFKIDGKSKMLEDLKLTTDDFDLRGNFHIDADDLVSSRGSLRFSKELLSESPIGRHIIGLVRGAWTLPFQFRLSGNLYRMNFEWDKSPLKDKVRQHLFTFFERMIDRRMDAHPAYNVNIPNESVSPG